MDYKYIDFEIILVKLLGHWETLRNPIENRCPRVSGPWF